MSELFEMMQVQSNKLGETNDCGVKALAITTAKPYKKAHATLRALGRKPRKGTNTYHLKQAVDMLGYKAVKLEGHAMNKAKTVTSLAKVLPSRGTFMVYVRGHVLAVKGGAIHDWTEGRRHRIIQIWRISKK